MKKIYSLLAMSLFCVSVNFAQTSQPVKLPSQSGKAGQYLKTNGSKLSWANVTSGLSGSLTPNYIPYAVSGSSLGSSPLLFNTSANNPVFTVGTNTTTSATFALNGDAPTFNLNYQGSLKQQMSCGAFGSTYNDMYSNHTIRLFNSAPYNNSDYRLMSNNIDALFVAHTTARVGIGTISPSAKLNVVGSGTTSATYAAKFQDSLGQDILTIRDDRRVDIRGSVFTNTSINLTGDSRTYPGEIYAAGLWAPSIGVGQILFHASGFSRIWESGSYGINIVTGGGEYLDLVEGRLKISTIATTKPAVVGAVWDSLGYLKIVR
ncbi:MAG: hypothetical protein K0R26_1902 [Bacteroidota bacterium]|jgi:hypothetical protein|nr:hypothetical protein [Bacteroidota bacterium]